MKIAWVTPLDHRSAIGRFSRLIVAALREAGHAVTELEAGAAETPAVETGAAGPGESDIVVYNLGDNFAFHARALERLACHRGVLILHDAYVLNLFLASQQLAAAPQATDALIDELHGAGSSATVRQALVGPDFLTATASITMLGWLARQADGIVAHASFYEAPLRAACAGPVDVIPLAYDSLGKFTPLREREPAPEFRVLTFGHVNTNRRVDSVLRAIGGSPALRERARYRVVGAIEERERERLTQVAHECGVSAVEFVGEVSDEALVAELEAADVICGLRRPALEGASASAIEAMLSGRPLLVSDAGFYRDLPDDLVLKVRSDHEIEDIRRHLESLLRDRSMGASIGLAAAAWAAANFSAKSYAAKLEPFLERVMRIQPLLRTSEQIARDLASLGLRRGDPAVARIASVMEGLFESNATPSGGA